MLLHVDILVRDLERSVAFYTEHFGGRIVEDTVVDGASRLYAPDGGSAQLRIVMIAFPQGGNIELVKPLDPGKSVAAGRDEVVRSGFHSMTFLVPSLEAKLRKLAAGGVVPVTETVEVSLPKLGSSRIAFVRDPDGCLIEMAESTTDGSIPRSARPAPLRASETVSGVAATGAAVSPPPAVEAEQGPVTGDVPLTPIQHWFLEQALAEPHHFNQAMMWSVNEPLATETCRQAIAAIIEHHDALRFRLARQEGSWSQVSTPPDGNVPFTVVDLSGVPDSERAEAIEQKASVLQSSLDLVEGPLLRAAWFDRGSGQSPRLLVIIHHLVVDWVSWGILRSDLERACRQLASGREIELPRKSTSFRHWSRRLLEHAASAQVAAELSAWTDLPWDEVGSLPVDLEAGEPTVGTADHVHVSLDAGRTRSLQEEAFRAYRLQPHEVLLTAVAQTLADWTHRRSVLIDLEGHDREDLFDDVDLSQTVGWFTAIFPIVLSAPEEGDPGVALRSCKERLRGIPNHGIGYGLLRTARGDDPATARLRALPRAEVSFNYLGQTDQVHDQGRLFGPAPESAGASRSPNNRRAHLLEITGSIIDGRLQVTWTFSTAVHERRTIERLGRQFVSALGRLIDHCSTQQVAGLTPSNFPHARLDQTSLDRIQHRYGSSDIEDVYALSPLQDGMLFHSLDDGGSGVYVEQVHQVLDGLDARTFESAWQQVAARHPALRTSIVGAERRAPVQVTHRDAVVAVVEHDLRSRPEPEQRAWIERFLEDDQRRGFDLADRSLVRVTLIRVDDARHEFVCTFHHIVLDGWSVALVLGEVFRCYTALQQGRAADLPTCRPYREYIEWLAGQNLASAETYWRDRLAGFDEPTALTWEAPRRDEVRHHRERQIRLSVDATTRLRAVASRARVTLNTVALAGWSLLLSRYSGRDDVVFGTTVSGRPGSLRGVESMVGPFINTLPTRVRLDGDPLLHAWLKTIQMQQAELREYEYSPLWQVQRWSELGSGVPLFDSLVVFENYPVDPDARMDAADGLRILEREARTHSNYPLSAVITPGRQLGVVLKYDRSVFEEAVVGSMARHLVTILEGFIAADPDVSIDRVSMLEERERERILVEWNDVALEAPQGRCVHELFETQAALAPETVALATNDRCVSYAELDAGANRLAHTLRDVGVGPDHLVAIYAERGIETIEALLAVHKAGGAYVPLGLNLPDQRLASLLDDLRPTVLLTRAEHGERFADHAGPILYLDADRRQWETNSSVAPVSNVEPGNLAYVIFTSGSSGTPKGVMVEHRQLCGYLYAMLPTLDLPTGSNFALLSPLSTDLGNTNLFVSLCTAGTLYIVTEDLLHDPEELARFMQKGPVDFYKTTPSLVEVMLATAPDPRQVLPRRLLNVAGEPTSWNMVDRICALAPGCGVLNAYGPTETTISMLTHRVAPEAPRPSRKGPPLGRPIPNARMYILGANAEPVPVGVPGELFIGGVGVSRGYLNRPALTADRFVPDPFAAGPGARMYRTGDIVRYQEDGAIDYIGRDDGQVKIRGFRIELGEIESVLGSHPNVAQTVVTVWQPEPDRKRLVAYVVASGETEAHNAELRAFLSDRLPDYMVPSMILTLESLPLTASGKVDRRALPPPPERLDTQQYVAPRDELERALVRIWQGVLGTEGIGVLDSFFDVGGDSIRGAILLMELQQKLGDMLYITALFDAPTIADFANYLRTHYAESVPRLCAAGMKGNRNEAVAGVASSRVDTEAIDRLRQIIGTREVILEAPAAKARTAVFILSPPRSGSTLLRVMLAGHPELFAPPEFELLPFATLSEREAACVGRHAYALEGTVRAVMELHRCDADRARQIMDECTASGLTVIEFYRRLQGWLGPRMLVEKSTSYGQDVTVLRRIEAAFEEPLYIHLVRHPCAMLHSYVEARIDRAFRRRHPFGARQLGELMWIVQNQNILTALREVPAGRHHRVHFEALLEDPEATLGHVCRFMDVELHHEMLEPYHDRKKRMTDGLHAVSRSFGDPKFHEHDQIDPRVAHRWIGHVDPESLNAVTRELAHDLGYALALGSANAPSTLAVEDADELSDQQVLELLRRLNEQEQKVSS